MKKLSLLFLLFTCLSISLFAQADTGKDKIILLNGNIKKCFVQTYDESMVTFKMREDDQVQEISTDKIFMILDENNDELFFYGCSDNKNENNNEDGSNNNQGTKKECEKNKTGDWCFKNNSTYSIRIWVVLSGIGMEDPSAKTIFITVLPGESDCFSDLPSGAKSYRVAKLLPGNTTGAHKDGKITIKSCDQGATEINF